MAFSTLVTTLIGGAGADKFTWQIDAALPGYDVIKDFDPLQDALEFYDPYGGSSPVFSVGSSADGDVAFKFNGGTVELVPSSTGGVRLAVSLPLKETST